MIRTVQDGSGAPGGRFARLNRWEAGVVDRVVPDDPAPTALVRVSVLANGGRLWLAVAAAMALHPRLRPAAIEGVAAILLAAGATQTLNRLVGRPRPPATHPARTGLPQPDSPSFPSSHAALAVAFTTAVGRRRRGPAAVFAPLAAVLAYGRVRLRLHWPTDVLGGAALGIAAGRVAYRAVPGRF
jgi:membrane-associated phospholipid phosphatase